MRLHLWSLVFVLFAATASAQDIATAEKVSFQVSTAFEPGAAVVGELRIPASKRDRLPAVLIVNSSPGFDGRSAYYAEALNAAGLATFEVDMCQGKGIPATARHHMPHVFESLQYLARHSRVDPKRVGIMGFSWGGMLSLLASSDELAREYAADNGRFAAHLALYPICWRHSLLLAGGESPSLMPSVYQRVTGRPVHILVGEDDAYDAPDACTKFIANLPGEVRPHFSLTTYPEATFAWDSRFGSAGYMPNARGGKGGVVKVVADPAIASRSREFAVRYFAENLAAN